MTIPFKIKQIEINQFAMFPEVLDSSKDVQVNTRFIFDAKVDEHIIRCKAAFSYKQGENLILVLVVYCYFDIDSPSLNSFKKDTTYQIPVDFLRYMGTITVGTSRGIIFAKTESTPINHIVLPPINLIKAINEDYVF